MDLESLHRCVNSFTACFSEVFQDETLIRFRDNTIGDMYDHNYTVIKKGHDAAKLHSIIQEEIKRCISEGKDYCQIRVDSNMDAESLVVFGLMPEITCYGLYCMDDFRNFRGHGNTNCKIYRVDSSTRACDRGNIELTGYQNSFGKDFCIRKATRNAIVYLAEGGVDSYICYADAHPVGKADLFVCGNTAMIEDFDVIPEVQRKGYGTALLRYMSELAFRGRVETVLLVTDMDDTAKDMYIKLGFTYVPGYIQVFYHLKNELPALP